MHRRVLSSQAAAVTRLVRFGYRRPPPWNDPPPILSWQREGKGKTLDALAIPPDRSSWQSVTDQRLTLREVRSPQDPHMVPVLAHGIEKVLRGDGVYPLAAPWTKQRAGRKNSDILRSAAHKAVPLYFQDSLRRIVQPPDIAWAQLPNYIPAAIDSTLHNIAAETPGVRYSSSTSSMTPPLAALYHLLSNFRDTELVGGLSQHISDLPSNFAKMHRRPTAFLISPNPRHHQLYSVNAHSSSDRGPSILRDLGHSMERMLTTPADEFLNKYVRKSGGGSADEHELYESENPPMGPCGDEPQFYHYSQASKFLLRAQIDCRNAETSEVFDVKTRAVAPIRYNLENYTAYMSHRLRYLRGSRDSYEREFYDMVRSVFLKYALQLRIGRMSGAFVAYHNTTEIIGLEYIPLSEIQAYVFGSERWADIAFGTALHLFEQVLDTITAEFYANEDEDAAGHPVKVVLSNEWSRRRMYIYAARLRKDRSDPLAAHVFEDLVDKERNVNRIDENSNENGEDGLPFIKDGLWHADSYLHSISLRGISIVGGDASIGKAGGEEVNLNSAQNKPKRKGTPDSKAFKVSSHSTSHLVPGEFAVWQLDVVPLVNDSVSGKSCITLEGDDSFSLQYSLKKVEVTKTHIADYVMSLGRHYVPY